jgi:hypothetical protein
MMTMFPERKRAEEAAKYMRRIRNAAKADYARDYWSYVRGQRCAPEAETYGLSYMGAQAVRMNLDAIYAGRGWK